MSKHDPQTPSEIEARLTDIRAKLAARTGPDGKPLPNYAENVAAIKAEILRLEGLQAG